jgi:hypothetical protein
MADAATSIAGARASIMDIADAPFSCARGARL